MSALQKSMGPSCKAGSGPTRACRRARTVHAVGRCGQYSMGLSAGSHPILSSDASRRLYHAAGMDERVIRRAALVTVRRAILERFLPRVRAHQVANVRCDSSRPAFRTPPCHNQSCPPCPDADSRADRC
jgi:hypothetical protein